MKKLKNIRKLFSVSFWLFTWQRNISGLVFRNISINILRFFLTKKEVRKIICLPNVNTEEALISLEAQGFYKFDFRLTSVQLDEINDYLSQLQYFDVYNPKLGLFPFDQASPLTNVAHAKRSELVKSKTIMDIANDKGVLSIVEKYLGATPTISNVNVWWSYSNGKPAEHAQFYHRDVDDFKFIKLFIYLTSVNTEADAPHVFVKGSHKVNKLIPIKRYTDEEVETAFGRDNVIKFIEPKGSLFLVDTYGMHKGLVPQNNNRLLLQIQYSLLPLYVEQYTPTKNKSINYDDYVNRLL